MGAEVGFILPYRIITAPIRDYAHSSHFLYHVSPPPRWLSPICSGCPSVLQSHSNVIGIDHRSCGTNGCWKGLDPLDKNDGSMPVGILLCAGTPRLPTLPSKLFVNPSLLRFEVGVSPLAFSKLGSIAGGLRCPALMKALMLESGDNEFVALSVPPMLPLLVACGDRFRSWLLKASGCRLCVSSITLSLSRSCLRFCRLFISRSALFNTTLAIRSNSFVIVYISRMLFVSSSMQIRDKKLTT